MQESLASPPSLFAIQNMRTRTFLILVLTQQSMYHHNKEIAHTYPEFSHAEMYGSGKILIIQAIFNNRVGQ